MLLTEIQQQQQHLQRSVLLLTQLEQMGDYLYTIQISVNNI